MDNLNKVMLIGNLTRDPELRYTPKGTAVADIGLAINRVWKDDQNQKQEETTFVDVTLWGRQAELAQQYLTKGNPVYIEGRLNLDTWDDKTTGQKCRRCRRPTGSSPRPGPPRSPTLRPTPRCQRRTR
jgi:single-strand DNA-binding protein